MCEFSQEMRCKIAVYEQHNTRQRRIIRGYMVLCLAPVAGEHLLASNERSRLRAGGTVKVSFDSLSRPGLKNKTRICSESTSSHINKYRLSIRRDFAEASHFTVLRFHGNRKVECQ